MIKNDCVMIEDARDRRREKLEYLLANLTEADVVRFDGQLGADAAYRRNLIRRDEFYEVAGARWAAGRSCVLHGHSDSAVLLRVLSGSLVEERYFRQRNGRYRFETSVLRAGCSSYLPVGTFHRLWCTEEAATVHAFDPTPVDPVSAVPASLAVELNFAKRRVIGRRHASSRFRACRPDLLPTVGAEAWTGP